MNLKRKHRLGAVGLTVGLVVLVGGGTYAHASDGHSARTATHASSPSAADAAQPTVATLQAVIEQADADLRAGNVSAAAVLTACPTFVDDLQPYDQDSPYATAAAGSPGQADHPAPTFQVEPAQYDAPGTDTPATIGYVMYPDGAVFSWNWDPVGHQWDEDYVTTADGDVQTCN